MNNENNDFLCREIFEKSPEAIVIINKQGKVVDANDRIYDWLGYKKQEIVGKNLIKLPFFTKKGLIKAGQKFAERIIGKKVEPYKLEFISKQGSTKIGLIKGAIIDDEEGKTKYDLVMITDVTDVSQIEEEKEQSQQEFLKAFENSGIGMALVSIEGNWIKVNDSLCEIFGYSREELLKKSFQDITHPEDLDIDLDNVKKVLSGKIEKYQIEKRYIHKNGGIIWAILNVSLIRDKNNNPLHFISQIQDITENKKSIKNLEEKLKELERLNNVMVDREVKMTELKEKIKKLEEK